MSSYNCYNLYLTFDTGQCIFCLGPRWTGLFDIVNRNDRPTRVRRAPRAKPVVSRYVSAFTRLFDALWRALLQRERRAGTREASRLGQHKVLRHNDFTPLSR